MAKLVASGTEICCGGGGDGGGGDGGGGERLGGGGERLGGGGEGSFAHEPSHVKLWYVPLSPTSNPLMVTSPEPDQ